MTRLLRLALFPLVVLLVVAGLAPPAWAHARLIASDPPGGATLTTAPDQVVLTFSERIETSFGGVQVFDPAAQRVEAAEPTIADTTVTVPLQPLTAPGTYTVVFRIISGDSHPVESRFDFVYAPPPPPPPSPSPEPSPSSTASPSQSEAAPAPDAQPPTDAAVPPAPRRIELEDAGPGTGAGLWLARAGNYAALTAVVGLLLLGVLLLGQADGASQARRRAVRAAALAALLWALSAVLLFVFGLSNAAARPLPAALSGDLPARFAATRLGGTALAQAGVALVVAGLAVAARRRGLALAALAVTAVGAFAPAWWGHAGTNELTVVALTSDWVHVLAATAWVGGLAALAALLLRPSSTLNPLEPTQRFSRLAGWALAAVGATGVVNALVNISAVDQLTGTTWGRLVLVKLALFVAIAALGWRNRGRMLPRLSSQRDPAAARRAFRGVALAEVALMVAAFGIATGLASSVPAEAEAASRIASINAVFGDGQVNLTVDPAAVGANVVHIYYLDNTGRAVETSDAAVTLTSPDAQVDVELYPAGPGHFAALSQQLPAAGAYQVEIRGTVDGRPLTTTGTVTVR